MTHWILGVVIAILVAVGGYVLVSGGYAGEMASSDKATPKLMEKIPAFTGSFFDLATRGGQYTCTIASSGINNSTTGTVYVSGTDVRGDFTTTAAGRTVDSAMLKLGDKVYVWGADMPQGLVMDATMMTGTGTDAPAMSGSGETMKQEYGWDCTATGADASKFAKPTGIEFMDLGAMMQGMGAVPGMPAR